MNKMYKIQFARTDYITCGRQSRAIRVYDEIFSTHQMIPTEEIMLGYIMAKHPEYENVKIVDCVEVK